jgi:hypothetical protein
MIVRELIQALDDLVAGDPTAASLRLYVEGTEYALLAKSVVVVEASKYDGSGRAAFVRIHFDDVAPNGLVEALPSEES